MIDLDPAVPKTKAGAATSIGGIERHHAFCMCVISTLRENALLIASTCIYGAAALAVRSRYNVASSPFDDLLLQYPFFLAVLSVGAFCVFALWFIYLKRIKRQADLLIVIRQQLKYNYLTLDRIALAFPILLLWPVFLSAFVYLKALISTIQPFQWDATLASWDRSLHFGRQPFEWLAPFLSNTLMTFVLNWCYTVWFLVIMVVLLLQAANTKKRHLRARYLLAQALLWPILGNAAAIFFSSGGPCYFGLLVDGPNPYAAHMEQLYTIARDLTFPVFGEMRRIPLTALVMQQYLWENYQTAAPGLGNGISACPSLHVASSWLVARLALEYGRKVAFCGFAFLAVIFISSIHLGWHYAIDGYLGMLGAWLCWRLAGVVIAWRSVSRLLWGETSAERGPARQVDAASRAR